MSFLNFIKIELPENPDKYVISLGLLLIGFGLFDRRFPWGYRLSSILLGSTLFFFGWRGLKRKQNLDNKKKEGEIKLLHAKTMKTEDEALSGGTRNIFK